MQENAVFYRTMQERKFPIGANLTQGNLGLFRNLWQENGVKWSGKSGQRAKMYPTRTNGYENDEARNFSDKFKATVAFEALRGDKTVQEIAAKRQLHPTQVSTWKRQAIEGMAKVFSDNVKKAENKDGEIKERHAKIGQLAVENDVLSQGLKR